MTISFPTRDDMLKERAMYEKAIEGLPKGLYSELLTEYEEWTVGLEAKKKLAIKNVNSTFKELSEESYKKLERLFSEARSKSGLEGNCEVGNEFVWRLRERFKKEIEEARG